MDTPLRFLIFYTTFILFVTFVSVQAGVTIFRDADGMQTLIDEAPNNALNPLWYGSVLVGMMSISSEFTYIYIVFLAPFIVGLVYIILDTLIPG